MSVAPSTTLNTASSRRWRCWLKYPTAASAETDDRRDQRRRTTAGRAREPAIRRRSKYRQIGQEHALRRHRHSEQRGDIGADRHEGDVAGDSAPELPTKTQEAYHRDQVDETCVMRRCTTVGANSAAPAT